MVKSTVPSVSDLSLFSNNDGQVETVVNSRQPPLAGKVNYNNYSTANYSGGTPRFFDNRSIPVLEKYRFGLQKTLMGDKLLARPVWILLPFNPDWRWLLGRSDSPWYPTLRLFRQSAPGDRAGVLREVRAALLAFVRVP